MFGRLLGYMSGLWLDVGPSDNPDDRFWVGAVVVNLTGNGNASRDMTWPASGLITRLGVCERNLASIDARTALDTILEGVLTPVVLPLIPLMRGGGEAGIITDWVVRATAEPDIRRRADYGGLELVFAEAADRREVWAKALEGWNMVESKQVMEWQAQALDTGKLIGRIQYSQKLLRLPVSSEANLLQQSREELTRIAEQLEDQIIPRTNGHS